MTMIKVGKRLENSGIKERTRYGSSNGRRRTEQGALTRGILHVGTAIPKEHKKKLATGASARESVLLWLL